MSIYFAAAVADDKLILRDEEMRDFMQWVDGESRDPRTLTADFRSDYSGSTPRSGAAKK